MLFVFDYILGCSALESSTRYSNDVCSHDEGMQESKIIFEQGTLDYIAARAWKYASYSSGVIWSW